MLADRAKGPQASFELVVATCQAADMAAVIMDMIKAIMDSNKGLSIFYEVSGCITIHLYIYDQKLVRLLVFRKG